jgi:hypothetical protein
MIWKMLADDFHCGRILGNVKLRYEHGSIGDVEIAVTGG